MQKATYKNHPSNPAAQPFNVKGRKNLTKNKTLVLMKNLWLILNKQQ